MMLLLLLVLFGIVHACVHDCATVVAHVHLHVMRAARRVSAVKERIYYATVCFHTTLYVVVYIFPRRAAD